MAHLLNVAVVSAVRTAVGRGVKGRLRHTRPEDMAATVMQAALAAVPGLASGDIDDVILGCAMPEAEQGLNIARNSVFAAGWPDDVPGVTVNRFCSSGLQAIAYAAQAIAAGSAEVICAGGVESMSMVPMSGNKVRLHPRLVNSRPEIYIAMGHTAERVASRFGITRAMQDAFAAASHAKAIQAIAAGYFKEQIASVQAYDVIGGKVCATPFEVDECPRADTTPAGLAKLRPAFCTQGSVTAGNSSPLSDGAAAAVLMSEARVKALGVLPLGHLRGFAAAGVPPDIMGIGPVPAIRKLLARAGLSVTDIDIFEINEAFAAQAVYCQRELGIPDDRLNVNGGAIALGHALGCTGAARSVAVLHELRRRKKRYGVVSMCIGGGMGAAGLYEATTSYSGSHLR